LIDAVAKWLFRVAAAIFVIQFCQMGVGTTVSQLTRADLRDEVFLGQADELSRRQAARSAIGWARQHKDGSSSQQLRSKDLLRRSWHRN
jgi:hypothetical protein